MRPEAEHRDPLPGPGIPHSCRLEPDTPCGMEPRRAGHEAGTTRTRRESVASLVSTLRASVKAGSFCRIDQRGSLVGKTFLHSPGRFYTATGRLLGNDNSERPEGWGQRGPIGPSGSSTAAWSARCQGPLLQIPSDRDRAIRPSNRATAPSCQSASPACHAHRRPDRARR
jgi:hypothetical protein